MLRGLIEQHVRPFAKVKKGTGFARLDKTLSHDFAAATLADPNFLQLLPPLAAINRVRLPVWRSRGEIDLLPVGYDSDSGIFTTRDAPNYLTSMALKDATDFLHELLSEVCFSDGDADRGKTIVLAQMLTFYARHLLNREALRPGFLFSANGEGAGKTTLARLALIPILGYVPIGTCPREEEELRKLVVGALREAKPVLFLDNVKHPMYSGTLEAVLTSSVFSARLLGGNVVADLPNTLTVVITGNGATFSPDLRRRLCVVELFLPEVRAENHLFRKSLDAEDIVEKRGEILGSLWSLVRAWAKAGCKPAPLAYGEVKGYASWSRTIGAILAHVGFGPLRAAPAELKYSGDRHTIDMEKLIAAMHIGSDYSFGNLVELAQANNLFTSTIGDEDNLDPKARSAFGKILHSFSDRLFPREGKPKGVIFVRTGSKNSRTFAIRKV